MASSHVIPPEVDWVQNSNPREHLRYSYTESEKCCVIFPIRQNIRPREIRKLDLSVLFQKKNAWVADPERPHGGLLYFSKRP